MFKPEDAELEGKIFEWKKKYEKVNVDWLQNLKDLKKAEPAFIAKIKKLYGATSIDTLDNQTFMNSMWPEWT